MLSTPYGLEYHDAAFRAGGALGPGLRQPEDHLASATVHCSPMIPVRTLISPHLSISYLMILMNYLFMFLDFLDLCLRLIYFIIMHDLRLTILIKVCLVS